MTMLDRNALMVSDPVFRLKQAKMIEEILLTEWDPIGVKNNPNAKAEYNQYALRVLGMIQNRKTESEVLDYLISVVKNDLELQPNEAKTRVVVRRLFEIVSAN